MDPQPTPTAAHLKPRALRTSQRFWLLAAATIGCLPATATESASVAESAAGVTITASTPKRELTPADAVATVRIMQNQVLPGHPIDESMTSPDGRRYVLRLAYGDTQRNGVWVDLLTAPLESLAAAAHPVRCAHLLTTGLGSPQDGEAANADPYPSNFLRWIGNTQVAFLWTDQRRTRQVAAVNLLTCKMTYLTHSPTNILTFGLASDGTLLFDAKSPRPPSTASALWARGFTVSDTSDGWAILRDDIGGGKPSDAAFNNAWFIRSKSGSIQPVEIAGDSVDRTNPSSREIAVAPNGRLAVTDVGLPSMPPDWSHYSDSFLRSLVAVNQADPNRMPLQYALIDLQHGTSRPLWNVPRGFRSQVLWSPSSNEVLLGPTFLPITDDDAVGSAGFATATVDVTTGAYQRLPIDLTARAVVNMAWLSPSSIEIRSTDLAGADARTQRFQRNHDGWLATAPDAAMAAAAKAPVVPPPSQPLQDPPSLQIEIRQDLNRPPQVFAVDPTHGERRLILDPNPHLLERFKLGHVERISGRLPTGQTWLGQLIYPAHYTPGQKYPLVIQSLYAKPWGAEEFTLDGTWGGSGMGLGPSSCPSYPGQLLATRNIAVLQLELLHPSDGVKEAEDLQLVFETLAEQLSSAGLIDRNKVALTGFSRNGYWVEFTLAHSKFPFAAAIAADNYDPSYFQSALSNWRPADAQMNGAAAFGTGLQEWIARAPGFNAEHIHTPLRIIGQSVGGIPTLIGEWEIYSRLHHLHKPVEFYLMPDINQHPSHNPQNPAQIMAIQEGVIDWLSFWLTGREDPNPQKRPQYSRWHAFRAQQAGAQP